MAEISYIEQNGQQVNFKDAKGRELLATKQNKLTAGRGISISEDGIISAISGGIGGFTEVTIKDCLLSRYSGRDHLYDFNFLYAGNPALIKNYIWCGSNSSGYAENFIENDDLTLFCWDSEDPTKRYIYEYLGTLPATEDNYLILVPVYAEITQGITEEQVHGIPTGAKTYFYKEEGNSYEDLKSGCAMLLEKKVGEDDLYYCCLDKIGDGFYNYCPADPKYFIKALIGK